MSVNKLVWSAQLRGSWLWSSRTARNYEDDDDDDDDEEDDVMTIMSSPTQIQTDKRHAHQGPLQKANSPRNLVPPKLYSMLAMVNKSKALEGPVVPVCLERDIWQKHNNKN